MVGVTEKNIKCKENHLYKRECQVCTNCVMDTTDSKITFDEDGVCDHCRTYYQDIEPVWNYGKGREEELNKTVEKIKEQGRGKDFDCIIGMSGGIDSSYLTYLAVEELGLRPLVFHVDAGWNSQLAVNNIEVLVDQLDIDLYTEVINWEEMRDLQLSFFKSGVPHIDTPQDHAFFATMYQFANEYDVKYILTGANYSTECVRNPKEWMYYQSDSIQLKDIHKKHGNKKLYDFPLTNILWHKIYLPYFKGIEVFKPLDYMPYKKKNAISLLKNKFGWQEYPRKHFESRFTRFYESYWLPEKFGYDTRKVQYASLILTDQMTREEALEKLEEPPYDEEEVKHDIEYVANKLRISTDELMSYMHGPHRTYEDYKNMEWIYDMGATAMRWLGLEKGGKR